MSRTLGRSIGVLLASTLALTLALTTLAPRVASEGEMLVGASGGAGLGLLLRPDAEMASSVVIDHEAEAPEDDHAVAATDGHGEPVTSAVEYVALQRQLIVPLVDENRVDALIVLSLSIEAKSGNIEVIYDREPKLRDEFLQVLFRHANTGGFEGTFTSGEAMRDLKAALSAASHDVLGAISHQVLVTEILRQEI